MKMVFSCKQGNINSSYEGTYRCAKNLSSKTDFQVKKDLADEVTFCESLAPKHEVVTQVKLFLYYLFLIWIFFSLKLFLAYLYVPLYIYNMKLKARILHHRNTLRISPWCI